MAVSCLFAVADAPVIDLLHGLVWQQDDQDYPVYGQINKIKIITNISDENNDVSYSDRYWVRLVHNT